MIQTDDHVPKYGMYSDEGDDRVDEIVQDILAIPTRSLDELHTEAVGRLLELSDVHGFEEAMDTVVRDAVWEALKLALTPVDA